MRSWERKVSLAEFHAVGTEGGEETRGTEGERRSDSSNPTGKSCANANFTDILNAPLTRSIKPRKARNVTS